MAVCQWHEARKTCLLVNRDRKSKNKIFLPLGRHSIMNGLAIPVELEKEHFDLAAQTLIAFTESTQALEDWCVTRSKKMFEDVQQLTSFRCYLRRLV